MSETATGPLAGIRVVDLSRVLAGPYATQLLADLGAEVIKIERPDGGDDTRKWGPPYLAGTDTQNSAYYVSANRGKRSVALDLSQPAACDVVRDLTRNSDVLVENFKVGGLQKFGLDHARLAAINPRLVYCSITGFGQTGPYAPRAGYDLMIQGMGGLMSITGPPDTVAGGGPHRAGIAVADLSAGLFATVAIQAALFERERSGRGQYIDLSLLDVQTAMLAHQAAQYLVGGIVPGRTGNDHPNIAPYGVFETADGPMVLAIGNDRQFGEFARLAGAEGLAGDGRFRTNDARVINRAELREEVTALLRGRTTRQWLELLGDSGVPCGPVNSIDQVFAHPQVSARGMRRRFEHPAAGAIDLVANPLRFSRSEAHCSDRAPPELGADTVDVLRELGYDEEKIAALHACGALGPPEV